MKSGGEFGFDVEADIGEGGGKHRQRAHAAGLILLGCGAQGEAIRLLYPLTIEDAVLEEGLDLLEAALRPASGG